MIEIKCPCCGSKIVSPDPPALTQEEKIAFRKNWDARYNKWCTEMRDKDINWTPPVLEIVRPGSPSYFGRQGK